ncbi:MAG: PAS domain-containing protein [Betaproteobacteria bacterium]
MSAFTRAARQDAAPALYRLLSDSAVARAALGACAFPLAILDAASDRPVTYVNPAFERYFGYDSADAVGRSLAELVFRGDEALWQRLLAQSSSQWHLRAWTSELDMRYVELSLGALRGADGRISHWVAAFHDRGEIEKLRNEIESLRALASVT